MDIYRNYGRLFLLYEKYLSGAHGTIIKKRRILLPGAPFIAIGSRYLYLMNISSPYIRLDIEMS